MVLSIQQIEDVFTALGERLAFFNSPDYDPRQGGGCQELLRLVDELQYHNPWFTPANVKNALAGIASSLRKNKVEQWAAQYRQERNPGRHPLTVAVVMAGNIPAVGFHDMISVLLSGNRFVGKLSSKDDKLLPAIAKLMISIDHRLEEYICFTTGQLKGFDAIIATGSDNSARYFRYYFSGYPHIIRKNRNGVAVISGDETEEQLRLLGTDVFSYFGLGCRNVASVFVPSGYDIVRFPEAWREFEFLKEHSKYMNNYEYYKAIFLINSTEHLDNGFALFRRDDSLASPVSVVHFQYYDDKKQLSEFLELNSDNVQCVVADPAFLRGAVSFGTSQQPELWDYADGVDTVSFLLSISQP